MTFCSCFLSKTKRALPVLVALISIAGGCSKGGGSDFDVPVNDEAFGSSSSATKTPVEETYLGSTVLPANSSTWVKVSGVEPPTDPAMFTQSVEAVNQVVFDSSLYFSIDGIRADGVTLYEWDSETQTWITKNDDPISFWNYYAFNWAAGGNNLSVNLPVTHTAREGFPNGDYEFKLYNPSGSDSEVYMYQLSKIDPDFFSGTLDINLFVYTIGEPNEVIPNKGAGENIKKYMSDIFEQVDISIGDLNVDFRNDPSMVARMIEVNESEMESLLIELSKSTDGRSDTGVNCFLFPQLPGNILGIDGAIPGPAAHGFAASGLLAQVSDYGYTVEGLTVQQTNQKMLSKILAHEIGHYLGLYHTSEASGRLHDPLADTPECDTTDDLDGDGVVSGSECVDKGLDYLMFWAVDSNSVRSGDFQLLLTRDEGDVANTHPLIR